jgi:hypothetical protein
VSVLFRIGKRRLHAKGDVRQIDAEPQEGLDRGGLHAAAITTVGSVISMVPPAPEVTWKLVDVYSPANFDLRHNVSAARYHQQAAALVSILGFAARMGREARSLHRRKGTV